jgi:hypothetical protein
MSSPRSRRPTRCRTTRSICARYTSPVKDLGPGATGCAERVTIHPDLDGYFIVADWYGGGRTAATVKTVRRRQIYPVPEEVLAIAGCSGTNHEATVSRLGEVDLK